MSRASKILSHSALDLFSSGGFFDPLNNGGEGRGLSFRLGGMKICHLHFEKRSKVGARRNLIHIAAILIKLLSRNEGTRD